MEKDDVKLRKVNMKADRDFLLELQCEIDYAGSPVDVKAVGYSKYKESWQNNVLGDGIKQKDAALIRIENLLRNEKAIVYIASAYNEPAIKFLKKFGGYPLKCLYEVPLKKVSSYFKKE